MNYIDELCSLTNTKKGNKEFLLNYYKEHGNYHNKLKVIHITGTAGKGSTASMIAKGLELSGYKVGLLTSPHLSRLNERIKINGKEISDDDLNEYIKYFFNEMSNLSFLEYVTLVAIKYFYDNNIDFLVCEVFVGGRYDLTNIFDSVVTVLTSIGLDHEKSLGNTKEKILKNKLGILRKDVPLFTRLDNKILKDEIEKVNAKYIKVDRLEITNLLGSFQKENAGIAYEVLNYLNVNHRVISDALNRVVWNGRLEFIKDNILVDSAHNILGMKRLKEYIKTLKYKRLYYLFAISDGKNFQGFVDELLDCEEIIFTKPNIFKIMNLEAIVDKKFFIENPIKAYEFLVNKLDKDDLLVICGSIYLAAEILEYVNNEIILKP